MSNSGTAVSSTTFLDDLDRVAVVRQELSERLNTMVSELAQSEREGQFASGTFGLERDIDELSKTSQALERGTFRLLILGDMKRGKTTFVNALLGENLLPADVSPCTAVLSVLKYGPKKQVTIHFTNGKPPLRVDFQQFKRDYTIDPAEAKVLENNGTLAFPEVQQAVIEYPLPLLRKGIELIDTPGLNDTEARNQLVIDTIQSCHAVLFVLSATQPWTLDERRYVNNYLRDRGLSLFFLINGWDRLRNGLADPDDSEALHEAETKVRQVFQTQFAAFEGFDTCDRVFEISALEALRRRVKQSEADLEGTGFPALLDAISRFLSRDRARAECQRVIRMVRSTRDRVAAAVDRRIPLLNDDVTALTRKINSVQTEFATLETLRDRVRQLIRAAGEAQANDIATSFKTYVLGLEHTFEADFLAAQPDLGFLDFLDRHKREEFSQAFQQAFERYMRDRLSDWERTARQQVERVCAQLNENIAAHQTTYVEAVKAIDRKLSSGQFAATEGQRSTHSIWFDRIQYAFEGIPDGMNGAVLPFNRFWQGFLQLVMASLCVTIVTEYAGIILGSVFLNVAGAVALGGGIMTLQAEIVRREFLKATRRELANALPKIAEEHWSRVFQAVLECFKTYEERVTDSLTADINARRAELDSLLHQKQSRKVDCDREARRLRALVEQLDTEVTAMEQLAIAPP
ncbi:MAG: dynamin family protein [Cyanobacteria bacterium P01_D01_bin.123]